MSDDTNVWLARSKGFASGFVSGIAKLIVGHPFDTVKTRMQASPPGTYAGPWECLMRTVRREGPLAIYKGASPPMIGWMLSDSVLLGSMHFYRCQLNIREARLMGRPTPKSDEDLSLLGHGIAGMLAGWTACSVITPVDLLKCKLQMQTDNVHKTYTGPIHAAKMIIREKGITGIYTGNVATLLFRTNLGSMFAFYAYLMQEAKKRNVPVAVANFCSGGLASTFFWSTAYPLDCIKSRIMSDSITNPRYANWRSCVRLTYAEGGIRAFYRGFLPCLLRSFPTNAAGMAAWEATMRALGGRH